MAESAKTLSDESSDIDEATSPEYSTSFESSSEEATPDNSAASSSRGKLKERQKKERKKFGNDKSHESVGEETQWKKEQSAMLDRREMEELSARILSAEQANNVEEQIRMTLMKDSRMTYQSDGKSFALRVPWKATEKRRFP